MARMLKMLPFSFMEKNKKASFFVVVAFVTTDTAPREMKKLFFLINFPSKKQLKSSVFTALTGETESYAAKIQMLSSQTE